MAELPPPSAVGDVCTALDLAGRRDPENPELGRRVRTALGWVSRFEDPRLAIRVGYCLAQHCERIGDVQTLGTLARMLAPHATSMNGPDRQRLCALLAIDAWHSMNLEACDREVARGLAAQPGAAGPRTSLLFAAIARHLVAGDVVPAKIQLVRVRDELELEEHPRRGLYHYLSGWAALVDEDPRAAREQVAAGLAMCRLADERWLELRFEVVDALIEAITGRWTWEERLEARVEQGIGHKDTTARLQGTWILADFGRGDRDERNRRLRNGLALVRERGQVVHAYWLRDQMAWLLARALENDIETEVVRRLVVLHDLPAPDPDLDCWPWPVRIFTMGRFAVERREHAGGRVRAGSKPVELLQALVAAGAVDVPEATLSGILWPDSDPDQARRSFEVTLHRLRKLLGHDILVRKHWRLSIDRQRCWVDRRAIDRYCDPPPRESLEAAAERGRRLLLLGLGPFLPAVNGAWIAGFRDRFHRRLGAAMRRVSERVADGDPDLAEALVDRSISLAETLS